MVFNNIYNLAESWDKPLETPEICKPNDYYGHARTLKKFADLDLNYNIKSVISHGLTFRNEMWKAEKEAELPCYVTFSEERKYTINKNSNKAFFAIGPYIHYAETHIERKKIISYKKQMGKTLLVIPTHSTHWIDAHYDIDYFNSEIKNISNQFNTVLVCIYWKDILRGLSKKYQKLGYLCTTAGHIYRCNFLSRLKSILSIADTVISNSIGTHLAYSIYMNKPFYYIEQEIKHIQHRNDIPGPGDKIEISKYRRILKKLFSEFTPRITREQLETVSYWAGFNDIKTKKELKKIFCIAEDMYQRGKNFILHSNSILANQIDNYISNKERDKAIFLINNSKHDYSNRNKILKLANYIVRQPLDNSLKPSDILIASYPRSGNTWLRLLISDIILQINGVKTETQLPIHQDKIIPDLHKNDINFVDENIKLKFRLIKSHNHFDPTPQKTIYLFRDPADSLCSYYYFHKRYNHLKSKVNDGIDIFSLKNIQDWIAHIHSYINAKNELNHDIFFISYESLKRNPFASLKSIANFLGLKYEDSHLNIAIENHNFSRHHNRENLPPSLNEKFFRKGNIGEGEKELKKSTYYAIKKYAYPLYFKASELIDVSYFSQNNAVQTKKVTSKVAQFCMQDFGGAGTAALRLHEGLTREGANNTFYVQNIDKWKDKTALLSQAHPSTKNGKFISPEWRAFQALNNQALSRYPNRPSGLEMFSIPWAATKLKDIPELQDADIINLHWISGTLSIPDNIDFLKGKKIVWTLHDMNPFTGGCHYAGECRGYEKYCGNCPQLGSNQENDLSREIWKLKKSAYRELDIEIVVLCDWMAKCVKKSSLLSSVPVHVIPNGLPTDVFRPYPQDQIRESLQVPKDAFVILFGADSVTNVRKGFVHLLRALEYLKESDISEQIALVTFGHNAQAEVQHLGFPTFAFDYVDKESELALVYSMADVTVIPSLEDNLPNVVLESLACGTPVVGFDVGGIPDMIEHQVNGYLAPIENDKELAKGIHWIMERKKTDSKIGLKCRETVLSRYNLPLQAKRYLELYENMLK